VNALLFAIAMEKSIGANLKNMQESCSPELKSVLAQLIVFQQEFEQILLQLQSPESGVGLPTIDPVRMVGNDELWNSLSNQFQPASLPSAADYMVLCSVHAMLDKTAQFYLQTAKNIEQAPQRLLLSSIAEMKLMLRRRFDGIERVVVNQVWNAVGFPPGMLAKE